MSFTEKRLCNPTQLTTSGQTLYTVPASKTSIIKQIVVTNVTASAVTFSLYIGSAATPNALFNATSVAANDTIIVNLSQVLNQFESLTALASTNLALNITISGIENDGPLNPLSTYIADQAITTAKLADSSVTNDKIANNAVTTQKIINDAITTDKIANLSITASKLTTSAGAVMVFASSVARASAIPVPTNGMVTYLQDVKKVYVYDGSNWLQVTNLDSSGRLVNSSQICFTARNGGIQSSAGYITYTSTFTNVGGHFSTSTGRFTAPVAGNYLFIWQGLFRGNTSASEVTLYKNGANVGNRGLVYDNPVGTSAHSPSSFNIILNLAVNDWVQPYIYSNGSGSDYYLNESLSQFSGLLIG